MKTDSRAFIGRFGEYVAAFRYFFRGALLRKRGFRSGHHEMDLILESPHYLIFSEVKTRSQDPSKNSKFGTPGAAVSHDKQRFLVEAARTYLSSHPTNKSLRFDVVEIYVRPRKHFLPKILKVHIIEDAFSS